MSGGRAGSATHCCPIGAAPMLPSIEPVVDHRWCFDAWAERLASLLATYPEARWPPPSWVLYAAGGLEVAYTAMDWVNPAAAIALAGIPRVDTRPGWV